MSTPNDLFERIVAEYGGADRLSLVQLAAARALSNAIDGDSLNPKEVADLAALLPAKPVDAPAYDLTRLNDTEFAQLNGLLRRAAGETPAPSVSQEPKPVRRRKRSRRAEEALELAAFLDRIEAPGKKIATNSAEATEIRNAIVRLLCRVTCVNALWPEARQPKPATPEPAPAEPIDDNPAADVVPLPRSSSEAFHIMRRNAHIFSR
jgi:hypothetical protein